MKGILLLSLFCLLLLVPVTFAVLPSPDVYYSFKDSSGIYNTTFWQDLSGNNRHGVPTTGFVMNKTYKGTGVYSVFSQQTSSTTASYVNVTGLGNYNSIGQCFAYAFYYDANDYNQTSGAAWLGRLASTNASPSTNFLISAAGNTSTADNFFNTGYASTLRMGGGAALTMVAGGNNATRHIAVRFCDNVSTVFVDGVSATNVSFPSASYEGFQQQWRILMTGSAAETSNYVPTIGYELRIWTNETPGALTDADLLALTSENVILNVSSAITNTFPRYQNIVRQRDFDTDLATMIFQGFASNGSSLTVTVRHNITGVTYVGSGVANNTNGYYINVTDVPVGCYNWTVAGFSNTTNGTMYCVGDVILWSGQSNTQMGGSLGYGWNYSLVNYNVTKPQPISLWDTGSTGAAAFYYPDYFNIANTSTWNDASIFPTAREIAVTQGVPVMILSPGIGNTAIVNFTNPLFNGYTTTYSLFMNNATIDGRYAFGMWMQGENDAATAMADYSRNLTALHTIWTTNFTPEYTPTILVPVGPYSSGNTTGGVCIPSNQQRNSVVSQLTMAANTSSDFVLGGLIYDIANELAPAGCIHISDLGSLYNGSGYLSSYPYSLRVMESALHYVYGGTLNRPLIEGFYLYNFTTIRVVFDRNIETRTYKNLTNVPITGLDLWSVFYSGNFSAAQAPINRTNITSTSIVDNTILEVVFNVNISRYPYATYGVNPVSTFNQSVVVTEGSTYPYGIAEQTLWTTILSWAQYECESGGGTYANGECTADPFAAAREGVTNITTVALTAFGLLSLIVLVGAGYMLMRLVTDGDATMLFVLLVSFIGLAIVLLAGIWVVSNIGGAINSII